MADEIVGRRSEVKVDVWNKALDRIGVTEVIEEEGEDRVTARVCRSHYDDCLEEALASRDWSFARKQTFPAALASTRVGWAYTYALPADFIAPRAILANGTRYSLAPKEEEIPYELQANDAGDGQVLCTDFEFADATSEALEYTFRAQAVQAWPRRFLSGMAFRLAVELALAIPKDPTRAATMAQAAEDAFTKAFSEDLNGKTPDQPLEAESIRARG